MPPFTVNPPINAVFNNGVKTYRWDGNSWTRVSATLVSNAYYSNVEGSIIPLIDDSYNLGSDPIELENVNVGNTTTSNNWVGVFTSNTVEETNLFFTNSRVGIYLSNLSANIIPNTNNLLDLGNTNNKFNQLFLSGNTSFTPSNSFISNTNFSGITYSKQLVETSNSLVFASGNVIHDFGVSGIFYHSNINTNFTANFVNVPTTNNNIISISLVLQQHANAYIANGLQINNIVTPIRFINGRIPSGSASNINIQNFSLIRRNNSWTALSSLNPYL